DVVEHHLGGRGVGVVGDLVLDLNLPDRTLGGRERDRVPLPFEGTDAVNVLGPVGLAGQGELATVTEAGTGSDDICAAGAGAAVDGADVDGVGGGAFHGDLHDGFGVVAVVVDDPVADGVGALLVRRVENRPAVGGLRGRPLGGVRREDRQVEQAVTEAAIVGQDIDGVRLADL